VLTSITQSIKEGRISIVIQGLSQQLDLSRDGRDEIARKIEKLEERETLRESL
jgi:hypothetical protein